MRTPDFLRQRRVRRRRRYGLRKVSIEISQEAIERMLSVAAGEPRGEFPPVMSASERSRGGV